MTPVAGKSIFIWNIPDCFDGDPVKIALWMREHGFTSVMVKAADGAYVFYPSWSAFPNWLTSMFRLGRPNADANFVDTLHAYGLKVYGWQFNYGRDPEGEGRVAAEQCNNLKLDGWVVDIEGEFESKTNAVGNAGKWIGKWRQYIVTPVPVVLCTWAEFYSPGGSQWHNISLAKFWMSLPEVVAGMPMVYEDNYGRDGKPIPTTEAMMSSYLNYVLKQWAFWTKDLIPAGRAYIGDGGIPTHESVLTFGTIARERCVGATYWVMDRAMDLPIIADALRQTPGWDTPLPPPDPYPAPVPSRYTGTVMSNVSLGLKVRTSPVTGTDVGKLAANAAFVGDDSFIDSKGGLWIHITSPATGWIASWYTNYTDHLDPPQVEPVPAIPGPFKVFWPAGEFQERFDGIGPLSAYPATVHMRGGVGHVKLSTLWQVALRAIMTLIQWIETWKDEKGWHNKPHGEVGTVQQVTFAESDVWVHRVNPDGFYEVDCYYNSETPPSLQTNRDIYRVNTFSVAHEDGYIFYDDKGKLPILVIANDRSEKLRIDPKYLRSTASLPVEVTVTTGGGNLNVRDVPSTGAVITTLPNGSGATVFELRKVGNGVWGRVTSQGSVPGWCALWLTDWKPV